MPGNQHELLDPEALGFDFTIEQIELRALDLEPDLFHDWAADAVAQTLPRRGQSRRSMRRGRRTCRRLWETSDGPFWGLLPMTAAFIRGILRACRFLSTQ